MGYTILQASSRWQLEQKVEEYMKLGYKPIGSVNVQIPQGFFSYLSDEKYTQAMVKEE